MGQGTGPGNLSSISRTLKKPSLKKPSLTTIIAILNVPLPTTSLDVVPGPDTVGNGKFASPEFQHRRGHLSWLRELEVIS